MNAFLSYIKQELKTLGLEVTIQEGFNLNEKFHIYAVRDSHSDHYSIIKGITSSQINDLDDNLLAFEKVVNFNKIKIEQKLTKLHGKLVRKCYRYTYPPTTSLSSV